MNRETFNIKLFSPGSHWIFFFLLRKECFHNGNNYISDLKIQFEDFTIDNSMEYLRGDDIKLAASRSTVKKSGKEGRHIKLACKKGLLKEEQ